MGLALVGRARGYAVELVMPANVSASRRRLCEAYGARIVETDPGVRGDTATGGTKPATLETGAVVQVPLFVNKGEVIRVDTRTSAYLERVS